jgi:hypothetical protein
MWSPGYRGGILAKNTSFGGFSTGPHRQDDPVVVGRILDSSRLATFFTRLEFAGPLYVACFEGERPGDASHPFDHPTSIHHCGMGPASGGIHLQKLLLIPPPPVTRRLEKFEEV